jgi:ribosomal RNA-processing protein 12
MKNLSLNDTPNPTLPPSSFTKDNSIEKRKKIRALRPSQKKQQLKNQTKSNDSNNMVDDSIQSNNSKSSSISDLLSIDNKTGKFIIKQDFKPPTKEEKRKSTKRKYDTIISTEPTNSSSFINSKSFINNSNQSKSFKLVDDFSKTEKEILSSSTKTEGENDGNDDEKRNKGKRRKIDDSYTEYQKKRKGQKNKSEAFTKKFKGVKFGKEFKSKRGQGDIKKQGKQDPYAYIPMQYNQLNKRNKNKGTAFHEFDKFIKSNKKK